ncbi:hypothetical protein [Bradyrhizobium sp. STM 3566]|uniref:hypothetical protein n=1 Tax=Bradyrhizobium sp. STM 3566 TaxID=578928 RepID=UPI00388E7365
MHRRAFDLASELVDNLSPDRSLGIARQDCFGEPLIQPSVKLVFHRLESRSSIAA